MCIQETRDAAQALTVCGCMKALTLLLLTAAHSMLLMMWVDSEGSQGIGLEGGGWQGRALPRSQKPSQIRERLTQRLQRAVELQTCVCLRQFRCSPCRHKLLQHSG